MDKHPKPVAAYSAAALLVTALAGGAYAFVTMPAGGADGAVATAVAPSPSVLPAASPSAAVSPTPAATPDVTADWKVYADSAAGISYRYPQSGYAADFNNAPEWKNARNLSWVEFSKKQKIDDCSDEFCTYSTLIGIKSYKYAWAEAKSAGVLPDGVDNLTAIPVGGETGKLWNEGNEKRADGSIERHVFVEGGGMVYDFTFVVGTMSGADIRELFQKENGTFEALLSTVTFQ